MSVECVADGAGNVDGLSMEWGRLRELVMVDMLRRKRCEY